MEISIYDVFELNRVLHLLLEQQSSYQINTAFKIHSLIKWLDETEMFIFDRMNAVFGTCEIDVENPIHKAFLSSHISFIETTLKLSDLIETDGVVKLNVNDIEILEKMLNKTID